MGEHYDSIVIGTGQAGPSLAGRLSDAGQRVAVIERGRIGGSCVNFGCIPTKALVASARAAHVARRAADFGVVIEGPVRVDMAAVHARMREISGQSNRGVTDWLERMPNVDLIRGHARFVGPRAVEVARPGGETGIRMEAERVFVNVGTRALVPPIPGLEEVDYLTSSDLLRLDTLPEHLVIVGGSYIGLELGQVFRRFGSRITILEKGPALAGREDPDVSEALRGILEAEGVNVRTGVDDLSVSAVAGGVRASFVRNGAPAELEGSHLLVAVGRRPNTDALGLDAAGVELDARGFVKVDEQLQTSTPGVWALGDVNGRGAFTHTSYNDYEIVAGNLLNGDARSVADRVPVHGLYTDPPLGRIGMNEAEARASGRRVLVGKWPMSNVGRAKERSETAGFIKILVDGDTEEILGASVLGIRGDEVVHSLLTAMYAKAPYTVVARAVFIHPTVSELLPTTLQNLEPLE